MNSASKLRWRARKTKESVWNDDSFIGNRGFVEQWDNSAAPRSKASTFSGIGSVLVDVLGLTTLMSSLYDLYYIVPTYESFVPWLFYGSTAALTALFGAYILYQLRAVRRLGSLRLVHNQTRRTIHTLRKSASKTRRHVESLVSRVTRLQSLETELENYVGGSKVDVGRLKGVVIEYREVQNELKDVVKQKAEEQILQAILSSDSDRDYSLSPQELERLLIRLKSLPGVRIREAKLRQLLFDGLTTASVPLHQLLALIKKLGSDAQQPESSGNSLVDDDEDADEAVFAFNPREIVANSPLSRSLFQA